MSHSNQGQTFDYLSPEGRLKLAERLIRFGMALPVNEFIVLLAIYNRTHAWGKSEAVIPDSHFLTGVRPNPGSLWDAAPLNLSMDELHAAVGGLVARRAVRRFGQPLPITYAINIDWEAPGFRPMWSVQEKDYLYRSIDD